jgi:ribose transport system ATP-binding protein
MKEEILRIENVSIGIEGTTYLDNINFQIFKGEIMGLIPLNNHGKSQLIQLISQNISIDFGRIYFDDRLVNNYEHSNMTNNKVYLINKQAKLIEDLKIIDNIHVLNHKFESYIIMDKKLKKETDALLKHLHINIQSNQFVSELSHFEKALIEMVKAVTNGVQLIILNEISNFLSIEELISFQELVRYYTQKGISFLYIANHHEEAFKICDRVGLFENGRVIKVIEKKDFSDKILKPYIIIFDNSVGSKEVHENAESFEFRNFTTENLKDISFSVRRGECITLLDINNKGIQDIAEILSGGLQPIEGNIILNHKKIDIMNTHNFLVNRIIFIPEDPADKMLFYDMSYMENLTFLLMDYKFNQSVANKRVLKNIKEEYRNIVGEDIEAKDLRNLDKSALYNLVYTRIQLFNPKFVFIMQPFSNADMYLRGRIVELINLLKEKGIGVVILAVSISDTLTVSDRLLIMEDGKILNIQ